MTDRIYQCIVFKGKHSNTKYILSLSLSLSLSIYIYIYIYICMYVCMYVCMYMYILGFPGGTSGKEYACQCKRHKRRRFASWVEAIPLEESMATHSSALAWRTPQTEESGGL